MDYGLSQHPQNQHLPDGYASSAYQSCLLSPRLMHALELAAFIHRDQRRKGTQVPYISHLAGVMHICAAEGGSEDLLIAALLHDSLEDVPEAITYEQILETFGSTVAQLVALVTKNEQLETWQQRAEHYLARLVAAPEELAPELNVLVGADKLYNLQSMVWDPASTTPEFWNRFRSTPQQNLWWYSTVYEQCHDFWSPQLQKEYRQALTQLEQCVYKVTGG